MISAIVITYNAERHLDACFTALQGVTDEIIVVDAMSTDRTEQIAKDHGVTFIQQEWKGYGAAKNHAVAMAKNDWVLSIDADEVMDDTLIQSVKGLIPNDVDTQYVMQRINHIGDRPIRFGHLKPEYKARVYNKHTYRWNDAAVHESLTPYPKRKKLLRGCLNHFSVDSIDELKSKYTDYARLDPKPNALKRIFSPIYHFLRCYVLQLGFLEGQMGLEIAKTRYQYTRAKYT